MIPVGTRVVVHWEYYDYANNSDIEYLGNDIFHGVVVEYNDYALDKQMKKDGNLKIKIDEKGKFPPYGIVYCKESDLEIEGRKMTESEIIERNASQGWIRCTEENYPDNSYATIIAYWCIDEWQYWTYSNCPFGWNVLCRSEAYWRSSSAPIRNEEE